MKIGNDIYYVGVNETGLSGSSAYGAGPRRKY